MKTTKTIRSFRLGFSDIERLKQLAQCQRKTQTAILISALEMYFKASFNGQ
jgi:predicted DNA-binding protein